MSISLESVLGTIETTQAVVKGVKTVCKNNEKYTKYIQNPQHKKNIKESAEKMLTFIETCEQKVDQVIDSAKQKFDKLTKDIFGVQSRYGQMLRELESWLGIPELEKQMVNQRLSELANEFPNVAGQFQGSITDRINLYITAITNKINQAIQALYDKIQEWVEKAISKLKEFIDPYLKKLKEFGDKLVNQVKDVLGNLIDAGKNSEFGQLVNTGYEVFKGFIEQYPEFLQIADEFVPGLDLSDSGGFNLGSDFLGGIENLAQVGGSLISKLTDKFSGSGSADNKTPEEKKKEAEKDKMPQKIVDPKDGKDGTFREGIFQGKDDPKQADFNAPLGMGIKETDSGGQPLFNIPDQKFNPSYTTNFPTVTKGGHVQEFDDTPGHERQFTYHPAGTSTTVQPDGTVVNKIVGDNFIVTEKDGNISISGTCNIIIGGNANIVVGGDSYQTIAGNCSQTINGQNKQLVLGDNEQKVNGNVNQYIMGNVKSKIDGTVDQDIKGECNQRIIGNNWQQVEGDNKQHVKGSTMQVIEGELKQVVNGNVHQKIDGKQVAIIQGDSLQKISGSVAQGIDGGVLQDIKGNVEQSVAGQQKTQVSGNLEFKVGGTFKVQSQSTNLSSSGETAIKGSRVSIN